MKNHLSFKYLGVDKRDPAIELFEFLRSFSNASLSFYDN